METIKEEKKAELEQLLNSLIEKGWEPFGIYGNGDLEGERIYIEEQDEYTNEYRLKVYWINVDYVEFNGLCDEDKHFSDRFSLREIISKGSGLWQFVCENDYWVHKDTYFVEKYKDHIAIHLYQCNDYRYWLLGSALCDEDKLEEFLLSNIKLD